MDDTRFDVWIRKLSSESTPRRNALKGLVAGALALAAGRLALDEADAKKRKKKQKNKKRNRPPRIRPLVCTHDNDAAGVCPTECCLDVLEPEGGDTLCRPPSYVCCTADEGGGACHLDYPYCCGPTEEEPEGFCSPTAAGCEEALRAASVGGMNPRTKRLGRSA